MLTAYVDSYGGPEVIELREVGKPECADDGVLVRVRAASINRSDWYGLTGTPYVGRFAMGLRKPKNGDLGTDFAGTVEAVGKEVTAFRPGDEVFGAAKTAALAEYALARPAIARKSPNVSFEEAATAPIAGLTALQALRDKGNVQPGQHVLVNGASGGVGTFAVQIAKAFGANVTAVCSTRNVELAKSLGADRVVDYTRQDFTRSDVRYDLMLDVAGSRSWHACKRVLKDDATLVLIGGPKRSRVLGPLGHIGVVKLNSIRSSRKVVFFIANLNKPDLEFISDLLAAGKVKPVIERRYDLRDCKDAFRYLGEGHAQGKLVIEVLDVAHAR